jgi:hypothetical protein
VLNNAEKKSIQKARKYLIARGTCALDGSGEPSVEALFLHLHALDERNKKLIATCMTSLASLYNVPEVGDVYDQQHSDTHIRAILELKNAIGSAYEEWLPSLPSTSGSTLKRARL